MNVIWDEFKNASNQEDHDGVCFEEAATVIANPLSLVSNNDHPRDPSRMQYLGYSRRDRILFVVTVEETDEEIRIISARKASSHERREYEQGKFQF